MKFEKDLEKFIIAMEKSGDVAHLKFSDLEDLVNDPEPVADSKNTCLEDISVTTREISKNYYDKQTKGAIKIAALKK